MKLLNEIIDALSSQSGSLTDALLKTKVLLHQIGHNELVEWVNHELNGYPHDGAIPEYRVLPAQILANMAYQVSAHPIPLAHLDRDMRESLKIARIYQSLAVLEKLVEKNGGHLESPIPMEFNGALGKGLGNGYVIQRAWCSISPASVTQIFVQVRSRLLDFVLGLKDQLGDVPEQEVKERTSAFDASRLFNNAIFGNNTTIVVGSNNTQEVTNLAVKGDFHVLADHLRRHGVDDENISALEMAIKQDENTSEIAEKKFGPSLKKWLQGMLSKAVDSSWQIELGVASSLLATALQKYYGWS